MLTEERKEAIISCCQELIRCQSYSGEEANVAACLTTALKKLGFTEVTTDKYGNVIGHIKGKRPGKKILFDGHIDTVAVTDISKWNYDPFAAVVNDGKIYGRGASDMKGAVSAMISAAAYFAQDAADDFAGDIYFAGVVFEECFEGVASRSISSIVKPDYVVIGEASELNLKRGQRGRAEIVMETYGKSAHSANPNEGINAVYKMTKLIERINKLQPTVQPILGAGILELTDIKSSPYPGASVVPEKCRVTHVINQDIRNTFIPKKRLIDGVNIWHGW